MIRRIAPEIVLAAHFAFVLFALFGGFLALVDWRWVWLHVPAVVWSAVVNLAGWTCPLTPLEKMLRQRASVVGYEGGFVAHYIAPLVYPKGMPRQLELMAGISVTVWNVFVYSVVMLLK
jgi:hypothetical protein